jgi:hypothetical protein
MSCNVPNFLPPMYHPNTKMIGRMERFLIRSSDNHIYGIRNVEVQNVAKVKSMFNPDNPNIGGFEMQEIQYYTTKAMNIYCYSDIIITKSFGWEITTLDSIEKTFESIFKNSFNGVEEFKIIMI